MPNIHHALLIGASVELVYKALTTQEGLTGWWTPGARIEDDIAHFPFGPDYFKEMKIISLQPFDLVKWTCIQGADEWIGTNISFRLIPGDKDKLSESHPEMRGQIEQQANDNCTLLIFGHDNWKDDTPMFAECSYTWAQFLRSLKLLCETHNGKPWPLQHKI